MGIDESKLDQPVRSQQDRLQAVGRPTRDPIIDTFAQGAEHLFIPKRYKEAGDWLFAHKEQGQPMSQYTRESRMIKWVTKDTRTIVLYVLDAEVPDSLVQALQIYCAAFFATMTIKILKPGQEYDEGKALPVDFFAERKIKHRDDRTDPDRQAYTGDILDKLLTYKTPSTYAILGVTMADLYAGKNWGWVFGWANFCRGSGVFSFRRYHPDRVGRPDYSHQDMVRLACHAMAHEICHMFAMHHCVYYECLMNGYNSLHE